MKKIIRLSALALMAIALLSCGNKKQEEQQLPPHEENTATAEIVSGNSLSLECNDQMQFTKNELRAPAGTITLTLKHIGKMDKAVMGHNLVILKPGTDVANFSAKAADAKATGFIPESEKSNVIAHTKMLGGGESDTIEFTIIEKGEYDYICSFPGHSAIMKGKLIIE